MGNIITKIQDCRNVVKKNENKIIEGLFVGGVTAVFAAATLTGSFSYANDKAFMEGDLFNSFKFFILIIILSWILYSYKPTVARLLMPVPAYVYLLLTAYNSRDIHWNDEPMMQLERAAFFCVLCFVAVLIFMYVKEDYIRLFERFAPGNIPTYSIAAFFGIAIFGFVGYVTVMRHLTYSTATFDFGIFAQMYEYMLQKGTVETTMEREFLLSHFGVHFSPVFYLTLPIYYLFPSPITVQLIQALVIALPVIPIVLLCRHYGLKNIVTIFLCGFYALYPATTNGAITYDIHENCFLTFLILMFLYYCEKCKKIGMIMCALFVCMVKEDAAIYIIAIGAYFLFSKRGKLKGIFFMIFGAIYFVIAIKIVNSYGLGIIDDKFNDYFYTENRSLSEVITTILFNPAYFFGQIIKNYSQDAVDKLTYIVIMFVPISFALFSVGKKYSRFLLLAPFALINLGTTYIYMHDVGFHYQFGSVAIMIYVIIMNLSEMDVKQAVSRTVSMVLCAGLFFAGLLAGQIDMYSKIYDYNKPVFDTLDEALDKIPREASVSTTGFLTTHLSRHLEVYEQNLYMEKNDGQTPDVDYLAIDLRGNDFEQFSEAVYSGRYELFYEKEGIIAIYKKTEQQ